MVRHSNSGMPLDKAWTYALAPGEACYVGEPVAIVVADDRYIAEDAAAQVAVDYEALPFVADVRTAKDSAPIRRELSTNVITTYKVAFGDVDAAFAKAAHVFKQELWQHRGAAHSIEARGLLAELRQDDGGITVHASTQKAHDLQQTLTSLMDFDQSLRVVAPDIGTLSISKFGTGTRQVRLGRAAGERARLRPLSPLVSAHFDVRSDPGGVCANPRGHRWLLCEKREGIAREPA